MDTSGIKLHYTLTFGYLEGIDTGTYLSVSSFISLSLLFFFGCLHTIEANNRWQEEYRQEKYIRSSKNESNERVFTVLYTFTFFFNKVDKVLSI